MRSDVSFEREYDLSYLLNFQLVFRLIFCHNGPSNPQSSVVLSTLSRSTACPLLVETRAQSLYCRKMTFNNINWKLSYMYEVDKDICSRVQTALSDRTYVEYIHAFSVQ